MGCEEAWAGDWPSEPAGSLQPFPYVESDGFRGRDGACLLAPYRMRRVFDFEFRKR